MNRKSWNPLPLLIVILTPFIGTSSLFSAVQGGRASTLLEEPPTTEKDLKHWSFQPLVRPEAPQVRNEGQVRNVIDRFILAHLEKKGLQLAPEADRRTLIRRVSLDLTGLPPSPQEVESFVKDDSSDAYEKLVNRLLNSDTYGERWAQHWLDVARFAESDGFEHDKVRKEAWRYRDWVIRALNADLPYNTFIQRQIAGDELEPDNPEAALATGFLMSGPDMPDINLVEERRHTVLNEMTSAVGAAIMGLGVSCAQCHDHKYDPISQADFYRMRAFFSNLNLPPKNKSLQHTFTENGKEAPVSHLMVRGDFRREGPTLKPGFLRVVNRSKEEVEKISPIGDRSTGRRAELARWLTQPDHPLTTRVMGNRLWMLHFGTPIVSTPNDFGTQGGKPSHPDLLDWLATELPRRGWSLKSMHRLIVRSATYRQVGRGSGADWEKRTTVDPENRLFSRMPRRRLSGEAVRDVMLSISGQLNRKAGGPGFRPPLPPEVTITLLKNQWPVTEDVTEHHRRSIYLFARRNLRFPMFAVFDRPDALASCARRSESTTALQSLTLFNSEFSLKCSQSLAGHIRDEAGDNKGDQVKEAYARILGRPPRPEEATAATRFLTEAAPESGLTDLCLALFNVNEFLYVD